MKTRLILVTIARGGALAFLGFAAIRPISAQTLTLTGIANPSAGGFIHSANATDFKPYSPGANDAKPYLDTLGSNLNVLPTWGGSGRSPRGTGGADSLPSKSLAFANPSGKIPGDGGFLGVHVTEEIPVVIDLAPWAGLRPGLTKDDTQKILGEPQVKLPLKWFYNGEGSVAFNADGIVEKISRPVPPAVRVSAIIDPAAWTNVKPGMTKAEVQSLLGEPEIPLTYKWFYGQDNWVAFNEAGIVEKIGATKIGAASGHLAAADR